MPLTKIPHSMIAGNTVSVADFGASTSNAPSQNVTAIQAAIDAISLTGGTVLIDGYYEINATITLKSDTTLLGISGLSGFYLTTGTNARVIDTKDYTHWRIENLKLDGSGNTTPSLPVIEIGSTNGVNWSKNYVIRDCIIYGGSYEGIYHEDRSGTPTNGVFDNVTIDRCGRNCVSLESGINISFVNCKFLNTAGYTPQGGIDMEPSAGQKVSQIYITNCLFKGNTGPNIQINAANWGAGIEVSRIVVMGNSIDNTAGNNGIVITGSNEVTVIGNQIIGNGTASGILVTGGDTAGTQYCSNTVISENNIHGQDYGILLRNYCENIVVSNNTIITSSEGSKTGIRLVANIDPLKNIQIIGNNINGNSNAGSAITCYSEDYVISNVDISHNLINSCNTGLTIGLTAKIEDFLVAHNVFSDTTTPINPDTFSGTRMAVVKAFAPMSAAPSTGYWFVGDTVYNNTPAAGQPQGWVCTVAGTPGTWKAMANLA